MNLSDEEAQSKIKDCARINNSATIKMQGVSKLFESAVVDADAKLQDVYREQMHALLDIQLDSAASQISIWKLLNKE
jgi:hypothetical protein